MNPIDPVEPVAPAFRLRFAPSFRRQKESLLAQKDVPPLDFPAEVVACLAPLTDLGALPSEKDQRSAGRLWWICFRITRRLWLRALGFSLVSSSAAGLATYVGMRILKVQDGQSALLGLAFVYFAMNVASHYGLFQGSRLRTWIGLGVESFLVGLISRKLLRLSAAAAARQSSGNLKVLITSDVKAIGAFLDSFSRSVIPAFAALAIVTPMMIHFSGKAGAVGVLVMLSLIPIAVVMGWISAYFQTRGQKELDTFTSLIGEWVKNIRLIRYLSWDSAFRRDVSAQLRSYMGFSIGQHIMACFIFGFGATWWTVAATAVVFASRAYAPGIDLAAFFGSLWLLTFLSHFMLHLPMAIRQYGQAAPSMKRIAAILSEEEQADAYLPPGGTRIAGRPLRVIFENVDFSYPGGKLAVRGLSAAFDLAARSAVVGEIGSGKTTFLKLFCGEYAPTGGRILIEFENGARANLWEKATHEAYRAALAYVPQEPFVASDPFHANVSLGEDLRESDLIEAAYFAELEADLAEFPKGIHQEIGEGGVNLSGGQKQRLNLARAFFSRRPVLVLDDTLSAVDGKTETRLMERLERGEAGFVLVTHRLKELARVHQVFVMKDGALVEQGTPEELAARPGSAYLRILSAYDDPPENSGGA